MLDAVRLPKKAPFIAPSFWPELWEKRPRQVGFGGFEAVLRSVSYDGEGTLRRPCAMEVKLHTAVGLIRVASTWDELGFGRLGTWKSFEDGEPGDDIVSPIEGAFPMPKTFQEAFDEYAYWAWRTCAAAMCIAIDGETPADVLREPYAGDPCLDLTVLVRLDRLKPLLLHALPARSIKEVMTRLRIYGQMDEKDVAIDAAVLRDLAALALETTRGAREKPSGSRRSRATGVQDPRVTEELRRDPTQSDRAIGRVLGVSPTTVGSERDRLGLKGVVLQVQRGDAAPYAMKRTPGAQKSASVAAPASPRPRPGPPAAIKLSKPQQRSRASMSKRRVEGSGAVQLGLPWGP